MDVRHLIQTFNILNSNNEESTIDSRKLPFQSKFNNTKYVISDADEEMLILVEFKKNIHLQAMKLYSFPLSDDDDNKDSASSPKQIHIYKIKNMNINFDDINSMKPDKSLVCSTAKLQKGQHVNFKKQSKISVKFKKIQFLALYIESNQNDTEQTYFNGITFHGVIDNKYQDQQILIQQKRIDSEVNISTMRKMKHAYHNEEYQFDETDDEVMQLMQKILDEDEKNNSIQELNGGKYEYLVTPSIVVDKSRRKCNNKIECKCINRICMVLNRYQSWSEQESDDKKENEGKNEIDTIYEGNYDDVDLLNDFNHLLSEHPNEFEDIYNTLNEINSTTCNLSNCLMIRRNQRDRSYHNTNKSVLNALYFSDDNIVRQHLLDRIHCYYLHSFDIGYTLTAKEKQSIMSDDNQMDDVKDQITDYHLVRMNKIVNLKRNGYKNVEGLQRLCSDKNKFTIKFANHHEKLDEYIYGFRYFYWNYYKNNQESHDPVDCNGALNVREVNRGSTVGAWYINKKYQNLKDELLNNGICGIKGLEYKQLFEEANIHIDTDKCREIKCPRKESAKYYEMNHEQLITVNHLAATMVYCNFDRLQFEFTKTFRKLSKDESDDELKKRHSNYYFLSRLLRECVECFGEYNGNTTSIASVLFKIKVWHGVNKEFTFSSMSAFIKGPISTTRNYTVAWSFCNNEGMILGFDISPSDWKLGTLGEEDRAFFTIGIWDCCWLSNYPNEQEIFSIGGLNPFNFFTIINILGHNYELYLKSLKIINQCFGGGEEHDVDGQIMSMRSIFDDSNPSKASAEQQIAFRLLSHELWRYYPNHKRAHEFTLCPDYFKDLFHRHCENVTTLRFGESDIIGSQDSMTQLMFKYDNGWVNLQLLTTLFPNMKYLIYEAQYKGEKFGLQPDIYNSVLSLLQNKSDTSLETIIITLYNNDKSYISDIKPYVESYQREFLRDRWHVFVRERFKKFKNLVHIMPYHCEVLMVKIKLLQKGDATTIKFAND